MKKLNIKITREEISRFVFDAILIILGTFIMSFGFSVFLKPNNIVPGGFMGLAQTIHDLLAKVGFTYISISLWYLILNLFLFIYALKTLGIKFGIRAGMGIGLYSLFVELLKNASFVQAILDRISSDLGEIASETPPSVEKPLLLFAIYGGLLVGLGMGLVFRANGSTGGCDMLALVFRKIFPNLTVGQWVMIIDALVIFLSIFAYQSLILPLYALITIFLLGKISDFMIDGVKSLRAYYILTDKKDEISEKLMNILHRGVTNIKGEGMFSHQEKNILLVMVTRSQVGELKNIVKDTDPNAFMFGSNVKEAYGGGFQKMSTIHESRLSNILKKNNKIIQKNNTKKEDKKANKKQNSSQNTSDVIDKNDNNDKQK